MAQITITIPDAQIARVRDAMRIATGNPNFGAADFKAYIANHLKGLVKQVEAIQATNDARTASDASIETDITIN